MRAFHIEHSYKLINETITKLLKLTALILNVQRKLVHSNFDTLQLKVPRIMFPVMSFVLQHPQFFSNNQLD